MLIIDAQIHLWANPGGPPHHRQTPYTIEDSLKDMDEAGIARSVNCPAIWDAESNDYAVAAATQHPDRFATLGWFPLGESRLPEFVADFLDQPGMLGLRFVLMQAEALADGKLDWVWEAVNDLGRPVALMVPKPLLPELGILARRYPRINWVVDHLDIGPFEKLPDAASHLDALISLAEHSNIAVKASGTPSMSNQPYPFADVSPVLRRVFDAYGRERMFWGTDFTRMHITLRECVDMFTEHLPWLKGDDLEGVMGKSVASWLNWSL